MCLHKVIYTLCIIFVMNLIHFEANHFFGYFFRWITSMVEGLLYDTARLAHLFYIWITT